MVRFGFRIWVSPLFVSKIGFVVAFFRFWWGWAAWTTPDDTRTGWLILVPPAADLCANFVICLDYATGTFGLND